MALINCPECKNSVSDQARACPNCGCPIKKTEYTTHLVIEKGGQASGREELSKLLREGWQIMSEEYEIEGPDGEGYSWGVLTYKLMR